jgi:histidine triad (HIT) family protein
MGRKGDCIFCRIIRGEEKGWDVYEDDRVFAFLDAFPVAEGHVIVAWKKHVADVFALEDEEFMHLFRVARDIAKAMKKNMKASFVNIITAESVIGHAFVHVVPRQDYDLMGVVPDMENKRQLDRETMDAVQKKLAGGMGAGKKV